MMNWGIGVAIAMVAVLPMLFFATSGTADAQCGSSASSCKNCHEVQAQDPVNDKGEWHTAHAFGDFCEFCHAGNVEAKSLDEAHMGMVQPLADVKASCQSCHPQDYMDRAQTYATALGVQIGGDSGGGSASGGESTPPAASGGTTQTGDGGTTAASTRATGDNAAAANATIALPAGSEIFDFPELYRQSLSPQPWLNTGDKVLLGLIVLLALAFFIAIWKLEHWGERLLRWWQEDVMLASTVDRQDGMTLATGMAAPMPSLGELTGRQVIAQPEPVLAPSELDDLFRRRPELRQVWPALVRADEATLLAMATLLRQDEGAAIIRRLGRLNLSLLAALRDLSPEDQALLLALARQR
jgi:hypothetical protein